MGKQHELISAQARQQNLVVQDYSIKFGDSILCVQHGKLEELYINGVPTSQLNHRGEYYCDNKQLTKTALEKLDLPHPKSVLIDVENQHDFHDFFIDGKQFVAKPIDGTNGCGVQLNINTPERLQAYLHEYVSNTNQIMLEEQVEGHDLRIQVIGGKLQAACIRKPAFVTGNGVDSLNSLIEKQQIVTTENNPSNQLLFDDETKQLLVEQQIELGDVPEKGREIQLKQLANMAQGAVAIDVTSDIHAAYQSWVTKLVDFLDIDYFGLDMMTINHIDNPHEHSKIIELNARADWLHHTFSLNRTHDIAKLLLQQFTQQTL